MATPNEIYKVALENREALNTIKDKAMKTGDFLPNPSALIDTDLVRITRGGVTYKTTVGEIKAASGGGDDNVQSDWATVNTLDDSFILNKPTNLSDFNNDLPAPEEIADAYADTITGILTGGEVTINGGNSALFDVAAGTGVVVSWLDPATPSRTLVSWDAFIGESIPDLLESFTNVYISAVGALIKVSGVPSSPSVRRSRIQLQGLTHANGINISNVGGSSRPAYEVTQGLMDYITELGVVTKGNNVSFASTDLTVKKIVGTTTFPFINRSNDLQNPTTKSSAEVNPLPGFVTVRQDGVGDFISAIASVVDPNQWDDGSGTLQAVPNNQWTVQRWHFFAGSETVTVSYGQTLYGNKAAALDDLFIEEPNLSPILDLGEYTTALIVKQSTTDLSVLADAEFVDIAGFGSPSSGGGGGGAGDMTKAEYDTDNNGVVDNSELFDGRPVTDFVLEEDHHLIHDGEVLYFKYPGNILKTLEVNDIIKGWWSTVLFIKEAQYNGGDDTLLVSYTIIDSIEF